MSPRTSGSCSQRAWPAASVEDASKDPDDPIYDAITGRRTRRGGGRSRACRRVKLVLTARAENYLHGRRDLADTIARLQAFQAAGADVLYAPGITDLEEIRADRRLPSTARSTCSRSPACRRSPSSATIGVRRVSVGSAFHLVALGAVVDAGRELLDDGHVRVLGPRRARA